MHQPYTRTEPNAAHDQKWLAQLLERSFGLWAFAVFRPGNFTGVYAVFLADAADSDLTDCT